MSDVPGRPAPQVEVSGIDELDGGLEAERGSESDDDERVDESSKESFPASDPPGFWAGPDEPRPNAKQKNVLDGRGSTSPREESAASD